MFQTYYMTIPFLTSSLTWLLCKPRGGVWFFVHPIILFGFICFLLCIVHQVGLPHLVDLEYIRYIGCQLLDITGTHLFYCSHDGDQIIFHDAFETFLPPLWKTWRFMFHMNKLMSFCHLPFSFLANKLKLCYWLMHLHFANIVIVNPKTWLCMLLHFIRWLWQWWLKQKDFTMINIRHMHFSPYHKRFWLLAPISK
jgi:hypothetical protein